MRGVCTIRVVDEDGTEKSFAPSQQEVEALYNFNLAEVLATTAPQLQEVGNQKWLYLKDIANSPNAQRISIVTDYR